MCLTMTSTYMNRNCSPRSTFHWVWFVCGLTLFLISVRISQVPIVHAAEPLQPSLEGGIGVQLLKPPGDGALVIGVTPGGSAAQDGRIQVGDVIVAIGNCGDTNSFSYIADLSLAKVTQMLRGQIGSKVAVRVITPLQL